MKLSQSSQLNDNQQNHPTQSLEFFISKNVSQVMKILINHCVIKGKLSKNQYELTNIQNHFQRFLNFIAEKNTSFILKSVQGSIIGISLNLDIKDLLILFETTINFSVFENLGIFTSKLKNWAYKLADTKKGNFLFNIVTVFEDQSLGSSNKVQYILRAIAFCKIIGWKSIIYPTSDPFLLLKFGAQIFQVLQNFDTNTIIQKQIIEQKSCFNQKTLQLEMITSCAYTYLLIMRMDSLKFVYIDEQNNRVTSNQNIPITFQAQNQEQKMSLTNMKICILPKL